MFGWNCPIFGQDCLNIFGDMYTSGSGHTKPCFLGESYGLLKVTRPSKMEVYHRDFIVHTGHIELFEQRDWREQQNIIDWVNHIGRIVKHMLPAMSNFSPSARRSIILVSVWSFLAHLGHFWGDFGHFWGNLGHFWTKLWHFWSNFGQLVWSGLVWSGLVLDQHWGVQSSFEQSNLNVGIGWDWMDGISLTSLTTRSPYGDKNFYG